MSCQLLHFNKQPKLSLFIKTREKERENERENSWVETKPFFCMSFILLFLLLLLRLIFVMPVLLSLQFYFWWNSCWLLIVEQG
jgi:hypothetical protein